MQNAVAFSDNDVITIAWSYGKKPEGCMGFAIYRICNQGKETTLPSHAIFAGETIKPGQTTAEFPVQKFYWKDPYPRLVAEQTKNNQFRYKIVPLTGSPGNLEPMTNLPQILSNRVEISPVISAGISAYFNRGLISTQRVARALQGSASKSKLLPQLKDPNSPLRASLAGNMVEALTGFLARAESGGEIYAALYELNDPVLLPKLVGLGNRLHIILSNSAAKDPQTGVVTDANQPARDALEPAGCEIFNRIMPSGHIGHNKFLVYKDDAGKARAVLFGSTNWTFTGLCAQTNNTVVIEDDDLAARYLDYWQQLANDTTSADGVGKNLQAGLHSTEHRHFPRHKWSALSGTLTPHVAISGSLHLVRCVHQLGRLADRRASHIPCASGRFGEVCNRRSSEAFLAPRNAPICSIFTGMVLSLWYSYRDDHDLEWLISHWTAGLIGGVRLFIFYGFLLGVLAYLAAVRICAVGDVSRRRMPIAFEVAVAFILALLGQTLISLRVPTYLPPVLGIACGVTMASVAVLLCFSHCAGCGRWRAGIVRLQSKCSACGHEHAACLLGLASGWPDVRPSGSAHNTQ